MDKEKKDIEENISKEENLENKLESEVLSDEELIEEKPNLELLMEQYLDGTLEMEDMDFDLEPIKENDFLDLLGIDPEDLDGEDDSDEQDGPQDREEEKPEEPRKPLYVEGDTNILFHDIDVADWPDPDLVNDEAYFMKKAEEESQARAKRAAQEEEIPEEEEKEIPEEEEKEIPEEEEIPEKEEKEIPEKEEEEIPEEEEKEITEAEEAQPVAAERQSINNEETEAAGKVIDSQQEESIGEDLKAEEAEPNRAEPEEAAGTESDASDFPEESSGKGESGSTDLSEKDIPSEVHQPEPEEHDSEEFMTEEERKDEEAYQLRRAARKQAVIQKQQKQDMMTEVLSWIVPCLVAIVLVLLLKTFVIINARVPSGSMENTIMTGDNLIGFRLAYLNSEPERGDIVIFYYPDDESQKFIKRIIGLPGESVRIEDGKVYIDGSDTPLEEDYLKEEWTIATGPYEFEIPENCYLMLGDNRNNSKDARYWTNTYVSRDKIIGKALWVYYPFSHWGSLDK